MVYYTYHSAPVLSWLFIHVTQVVVQMCPIIPKCICYHGHELLVFSNVLLLQAILFKVLYMSPFPICSNFSYIHVHIIIWWILLKCRLWFGRFGMGPEILHSFQMVLILLVLGPRFEEQGPCRGVKLLGCRGWSSSKLLDIAKWLSGVLAPIHTPISSSPESPQCYIFINTVLVRLWFLPIWWAWSGILLY